MFRLLLCIQHMIQIQMQIQTHLHSANPIQVHAQIQTYTVRFVSIFEFRVTLTFTVILTFAFILCAWAVNACPAVSSWAGKDLEKVEIKVLRRVHNTHIEPGA